MDSKILKLSPKFSLVELEDSVSLFGGKELLTVRLDSQSETQIEEGDARKHVAALWRMLTRGTTREQVKSRFEGQVAATDLLIDHFISSGIVVTGAPDETIDDSRIALESRLGSSDLLETNRERQIAWRGPQARELSGAVPVEAAVAEDSIFQICAGSIGYLREANEHMFRQAESWLPVAPFDGHYQLVGPVIIPNVTPCFECVLTRWASNTEFPTQYLKVADSTSIVRDSNLARITAALAERMALRWIRHNDSATANASLVFVPSEFALSQEPLFRVPRCRVCGPGPYAGTRHAWQRP